MAPPIKCPTCNSHEVEFDNQMGHVVCVGCGQVLEINTMVSELSFSESNKGAAIADGFTLKIGQARAKSKSAFASGASSTLRSQQESSEATRERGHASIERAGNMQGINMGPNLIEKAKRVFDVALTAKYTKGRKSNCVIAACCYITCRMEKTSHMMIDFADAFSTNVYQIGAVFLQLRIMFLENSGIGLMPLVDPGLYMARFADKLDFGVDTGRVVANANRVAQRMDRDWIVRGRRPAGICAASLFIASRMNGYKRTIREIVLVVKICEGTLRKRLKEFGETESGQLSKATFETINLDESANPPSFTQHNKRKAVDHAGNPVVPVAGPSSVYSSSSSSTLLNLAKDDKGAMDQDNLDGDAGELDLIQEAENYVQNDTKYTPAAENAKEDTLSDLDDDPEVLYSVAMSDDETDFKRELWMAENHDWEEKQKAIDTAKPLKKQESRKKVRRDPSEFKAGSAVEATRKLIESKPAMSKKINYAILNELLEDDD